ncbi:MAG: ComEC/Rec2 family competence protein [Rickettsiales bacterium]|jgi:competence protein ComEC|nr:ComEC/Rec2 family competence protein [Rickettsiales bacterium]
MSEKSLFLWIFSAGAGAALFFALPQSPAVGSGALICALSALCFARYRRFAGFAAVFCFIFGFFYAAFRADLVDTKLLGSNMRGADISGVVERVDYAGEKNRVFLRAGGGLFRISVPAGEPVTRAMSLRANLYAPGGIDALNRFDFARWSFWSGLSGMGAATMVYECSDCGARRLALRDRIHYAANDKLVDSLVLGYKSAVPRTEYDSIKSAGIAHVISISGFHMSLVGGWLFVIFMIGVKALLQRWVRRFPARNLALPLTMAALALYLSASGAGVSAIRSFIMAGAGFAAVLLNRKIMTVRSAALAFAVMLLINPFWIVSAGFQLSFAAVFGLVHFLDARGPRPDMGGLRKWACLAVGTCVAAEIWTLPFVVYHFGVFTVYGVIGNFVLLPVFSIGVMPLVMLGAASAPLGWRLPLDVANRIFDLVMRAADWIGSLPASRIHAMEVPPLALFLVFAGMFCFLVKEKRRAAVLFAGAAALVLLTPRPVLRMTADGEVVKFHDRFNAGYSERHPFVIPRGTRRAGECGKGVCEWRAKNWSAVSIQRFVPLASNIGRLCEFDFVISYFPLELPGCPEKVLRGSVRIYESGRVERVVPRRWGA